MTNSTYYAPHGGLPPQTELLTGRAVFTEAYAVIPQGRDARHRHQLPAVLGRDPRSGCIARPLSGFAETFSQYIMEVAPGGGSDRPEPDAGAEGVLFVVEGELRVTLGGQEPQPRARRLCLPPAGQRLDGPQRQRRARRASTGSARPTSAVDGIDVPEPFVTNERDIAAVADARTPTAAGRRRASSIPPTCATTCTSPSSPSSPAPSFRSPRRTSWSTASTCSRARRSTGSTRTGSRSRPATSCGCAPSARRPATPAGPGGSATCSTRTSTGT